MRLLFGLIVFTIFTGCGNDEKPVPEKVPASKDSTVKIFFPVTDYLRGQLHDLDSSSNAPVKITTQNGKTDSVWFKRDAIRPFAQPFLSPEIDSAHLANYFTQASFLDQTINAFTFSYDPAGKLPDTIMVKRWDIYIDPETNTVKRIFIIKRSADGDLQLTWTPDWCKITTIKDDKLQKEEKMIWNF